jgi:predicted DsbA family dithiol-disulfide isomerase
MADDKVTLEVFTDYVCPWCYLGHAVIEELESAKDGLQVKLSPFPLHPGTPPEGLLLTSFLGANLEAVHERLYKLMDELGLEHCERTKTYNSRLAQELGMWGDDQEDSAKSKKLHKAFFNAYFVGDKNLADRSVLLEGIEEAGFDVKVAEKVIDDRTYSIKVDEAWSRARQMKISAVPTYVAGSYITSGFHPLESLMHFIEYAEIQLSKA